MLSSVRPMNCAPLKMGIITLTASISESQRIDANQDKY
jgi:hypothetical protein